MSTTPTQKYSQDRWTLPASLSTSAILQITFVVCAVLFFRINTDDMRLQPPAGPPQMATLVIPENFLPKKEEPKKEEDKAPEPVAEAPQRVEAKPDVKPPKKPERIQRKKLTRKKPAPVKPEEPKKEEIPAKPSEVPVDYVNKAQPSDDPANSSPAPQPLEEGDGRGSVDGIAKEGDPGGVRDPNAVAKEGHSAPQEGIDYGALRKGYARACARAMKRNHAYPLAARRARIEGIVKLKVTIDGTGNIVDVIVATSSGHNVLDQAAIKSVRAVGKLPAPPSQLGWKRKSIVVPFKYRLEA